MAGTGEAEVAMPGATAGTASTTGAPALAGQLQEYPLRMS